MWIGSVDLGMSNHGKEKKMSREWKIGDRFSVEGVITEDADSDGDYQAIFDGHTTDGCVIAAEMAHAKLIKPAAPEPQKLDVTKPIRVIGETESVVVIGPDQGGWVVSTPGYAYGYRHFFAAELENIPEPKIKGRREAFLSPDGELYWVSSWPGNHPMQKLGRKMVEITEGDGMEEKS